MKFSKNDLDLWGKYSLNYFIDILNGDYDLNEAREDLQSLINQNVEKNNSNHAKRVMTNDT